MQPRHTARELALFSINQLPSQPHKLETKTLDDIVTAVVRSLHDETKELLQTASVELQRSQDRLTSSENRTSDLRQDIQAGLDSGDATTLDVQSLKAKARQRRQQKQV